MATDEAARTSQPLNVASLANDAGISGRRARNWRSILESSYVVYRVPPQSANFGKRPVRTPKLWFFDVGVAASRLGIESPAQKRRRLLLVSVVTHPQFNSLSFQTLVPATAPPACRPLRVSV